MREHHASKPPARTIVDLFDIWATKSPNRIAAEWQGETLTYSGLRTASLHVSRALLSAGVQSRARVPLLTRMSLEMLPAMVGILRVGACFAPMDIAAWSLSRMEAALFDLSSPVAVVTAPQPGLELPVNTVSFEKDWMYSPLENTDALLFQLSKREEEFCDDDLAWILFTSGTTGRPKGVMVYHRAAYAYSIVGMIGRSTDLEGMRCLLCFSIGFDGCASVIWTTLTTGRTLVMASSSNFPEVATTCDALMLTPSMLAILDPTELYSRVRYVIMGAEGPNPDVVRRWARPHRKLFTTYGPTETTCNMTLGELKPGEEVTLGDLLPGFRVVLVDRELQECDSQGEILIAGPGLAAGYINNPELTAEKFILWKGERFYRTGDLARKLDSGQLVWAGRVDSLVKNRGFLINLETEVETGLLSFPPVILAAALKWRDKLVAYIRPATVDIDELRGFMKRSFDHFIVPDEIFAVDSFPLNVSGKVDHHALRAHREAKTIQADGSVLSDRSLSVSDALRLVYSECLHVPFWDLDKNSSFTRLGGNSLTAIRVSQLLKKHGHRISVIKVLRLDTVGALEESLNSFLKNPDSIERDDNNWTYNSGEAYLTASQRVFLSRSLLDPVPCALIGVTEYIGSPLLVPTAAELHDAFLQALSAHSIFQTRFDMARSTLSPLGRLNLDWRHVSVPEIGFKNACEAAEEQAWHDLKSVNRVDNEVPYFQITCVSVPARKALAYVTRIHHVLIDVVSQSLLSHDIDRALSGKPIASGPRIADFARFMHTYERDNLERAIHVFGEMVKSLPETAVLQLPRPDTPLPPLQYSGLIRIKAPMSLRKTDIDQAACALRITTSTLVYAAWALFLRQITTWDRVGFRISLSGRTVPWSAAQSIVGCLVDSAPFSTAIPTNVTIHSWLASVHQVALDVLEFDGLAFALPDSFRSDPRTNTTNVLCFLDMEAPSTSNWSYREMQRHNYMVDWYVFQENEGVSSMFEIQSTRVDLAWAEGVASIPGNILERLVSATPETSVGDLLRSMA